MAWKNYQRFLILCLIAFVSVVIRSLWLCRKRFVFTSSEIELKEAPKSHIPVHSKQRNGNLKDRPEFNIEFLMQHYWPHRSLTVYLVALSIYVICFPIWYLSFGADRFWFILYILWKCFAFSLYVSECCIFSTRYSVKLFLAEIFAVSWLSLKKTSRISASSLILRMRHRYVWMDTMIYQLLLCIRSVVVKNEGNG